MEAAARTGADRVINIATGLEQRFGPEGAGWQHLTGRLVCWV